MIDRPELVTFLLTRFRGTRVSVVPLAAQIIALDRPDPIRERLQELLTATEAAARFGVGLDELHAILTTTTDPDHESEPNP